MKPLTLKEPLHPFASYNNSPPVSVVYMSCPECVFGIWFCMFVSVVRLRVITKVSHVIDNIQSILKNGKGKIYLKLVPGYAYYTKVDVWAPEALFSKCSLSLFTWLL